MPAATRRFLVLSIDPDTTFFIVRTLLRKFPSAEVTDKGSLAQARDAVHATAYDGIVVHRAAEADAMGAVSDLRKVGPTTPIILLSSTTTPEAASAAGATRFLDPDEWLLVGTLMEKALAGTD